MPEPTLPLLDTPRQLPPAFDGLVSASVVSRAMRTDTPGLRFEELERLAAERGIQVPERLEGAVRKRVREYLAGRLCAADALEVFGAEAVVEMGDDTAPRWPAGCVGSISHTADVAWACVASSADLDSIGIDVERRVPEERSEKLRRRVLTERDQALEVGFAKGPGAFFTLVFSGKESAFKALFPLWGEFLGFHDLELVEVDLQLGAFSVQLNRCLGTSIDSTPSRPPLHEGERLQGRFVLTANHVLTAVEMPAT